MFLPTMASIELFVRITRHCRVSDAAFRITRVKSRAQDEFRAQDAVYSHIQLSRAAHDNSLRSTGNAKVELSSSFSRCAIAMPSSDALVRLIAATSFSAYCR